MTIIDQTTHADFERATRKAFWNQIKHWLTRRSNELLPFDEVQTLLPIAAQHYRGLLEVPLAQIVGSVGRYRDFDRAFLPVQRSTRDRWLSVDKAHLTDVRLPPIEVYKIGEAYFVRDGNHRVSVGRERGQEFIDAVVIEIESPVPLTPDADLDELIRRVEKADFFLRTDLNRLRPDHGIRLTLPGQYEKLLEHIQVHRWYLGVENQREIGWHEAVQSWYDRFYEPLVEYIREQNILADFPNRTESDLYLWIIEHRAVLRGDANATPVEEAASDFVERRSERHSRRLARMVKNTLNALGALAEEVVESDTEVGAGLPGRKAEVTADDAG